MDDISSDDEEV